MSETKLRAYRVSGPEPSEGACIVFARSSAEAKRMGHPIVMGWMTADSWTDVRVHWLRGGADFHRMPEHEATGQPYVVESPRVCERCEMWYADGLDATTGLCEACFIEASGEDLEAAVRENERHRSWALAAVEEREPPFPSPTPAPEPAGERHARWCPLYLWVYEVGSGQEEPGVLDL